MLIKNFTNDKFIRAYNSFANVNSPFHLNDEEFYLYSVLFTNQMMDGSIRTNIDILNQFVPIKFIKNDTKNKDKIRKIVTKLIEKKVLIVENEFDEFKNYTLLELSVNDKELSNDGVAEEKQVTDKHQNFSKIPYSKFLEFTSTNDYYIYYTVSRWSKGFNFSYKSWAEVLGLKHQESAIRVIEDAVKREIIYKNIGDYNSPTKQDANVYSITPFTESQKSKQSKKVEQIEANDVREEKLAEIVYSNEDEKDIQDAMYFFKTYKDEDGDVYPQDYHYALYLEIKENLKGRKPTKLEQELIMVAEKRMGYLKNNPQYQKEYAEGEAIFKRQRKEFIVRQLEQASNAIKMKDGSVVIVDEGNIDSIDWKQVHSTYYGSEFLQSNWELSSFQPREKERPDMIEYGWELYKEHVKTGQLLTYDLRGQMQSKVFEDLCFINNVEPTQPEIIDYSVVHQEACSAVYTREDMIDDLNRSVKLSNTYKPKRKSPEEEIEDLFG